MKGKKRPLSVIADEIRAEIKTETVSIIKTGALLVEGKRQLRHGKFLPWVKSEFSMSDRSAQNYMAAYRFITKYESGSHFDLSPSAIYLMSRPRDQQFSRLFTPAAITAILEEAKQNRVGKDRALEIARSMQQLKPVEEPTAEHAPEQENEQTAADEAKVILDGPPPALPPSPPPDSTPSPRGESQIAAFKNAIEALNRLGTQPAAKFSDAAAPNDLIKAIDFLNTAAKSPAVGEPKTARELEIRYLGLQSENEKLKERIAELVEGALSVLHSEPAAQSESADEDLSKIWPGFEAPPAVRAYGYSVHVQIKDLKARVKWSNDRIKKLEVYMVAAKKRIDDLNSSRA